MYEDIIKSKKETDGGFSWDWDQYKKEPYCPSCNSKNLRNTKDLLKDKKLTNWKICKNCGQEWKEVFNEDLELELTEAIFNGFRCGVGRTWRVFEDEKKTSRLI